MQLDNTLRLFEADLVGLAPSTRRAYAATARELVRLLGPDRPVDSLIPAHFLGLARALKRREYSHSTANTYAVVAHKLLDFWMREELLVLPPAAVLKIEKALRDMRPKALHDAPYVPSQGDLIALVVAALTAHDRPAPLYERDIALIEVLIATGMRIAEVSALTCGQVDRLHHWAKIRGKGRRQRTVYLSAPALAALERYWTARGDSAPHSPALASHSDGAGRQKLRPISTAGLRLAFDRLVDQAGLPAGITPHKLRHAFASNLQRATHDISLVQRALGHANLSSTQVYVHADDREVAAAVNQLHQAQTGQS